MTLPVSLRLHTGLAELHTNSGASFAPSRTEKPTTRVTSQRNRSYKYSWPVSGTPQMRYMSRTRVAAAHRPILKIATNPSLTDLDNQILSEYLPPASDPTAKWCIILCIIPWLAAMSTLLNPTDLEAAHRRITTTNSYNRINVVVPSMKHLNLEC